MEFNPSTLVEEFISQLNRKLGLPEPCRTGFALMSDWPGTDDPTAFHLFPQSKLCDVISLWTSALEELNQPGWIQHRGIMLSYCRRLCLREHQGKKTDQEALLLAYQLSKEVLSGRHPTSSMEEGVRLTSLMAQIEYGDYGLLEGGGLDAERLVREAVQRFCPSRFTYHALEHDQR